MSGEEYMEVHQHTLDEVIIKVKNEVKVLGSKRKGLVITLGNKLLETGIHEESICEEIKSILVEEIVRGDISRRDIERYAPDNWKRKTRPKKENDILSFPQSRENPTPIVIDTEGKDITDDPIRDYDEVNRHTDPSVSGSQTLEFEIPLPYSALQRYMSRQNATEDGSQSFWVHGILNKHTGEAHSPVSWKTIR